MTTETLLLLVMIVFIIGVFPSWPHSRSLGYAPSGVLTVLLIIFVIWAVADGRPLFRNSKGNIQTTVEDAGHDIKSAGRDVAASIRDTVR